MLAKANKSAILSRGSQMLRRKGKRADSLHTFLRNSLHTFLRNSLRRPAQWRPRISERIEQRLPTYFDYLLKRGVQSATGRKRVWDLRCGILAILNFAAGRPTMSIRRVVAICCSSGGRYRSGNRPGMRNLKLIRRHLHVILG